MVSSRDQTPLTAAIALNQFKNPSDNIPPTTVVSLPNHNNNNYNNNIKNNNSQSRRYDKYNDEVDDKIKADRGIAYENNDNKIVIPYEEKAMDPLGEFQSA